MAAPTIRPSSTPASEWMQNLNLVFKNFDESFLKSPLFYGNTPHVIPEKITESFVDPSNNGRLYRIKWLDTWISEQIVISAFPHLIAEFWINKQILNEPLDFTGTIDGANAARTLSQLPINTMQTAELSKGQGQDGNPNHLSISTSSQSSSSQTLTLPPALFPQAVPKQPFRNTNGIPTQVAGEKIHDENSFTVEHDNLSLKVNSKDLKDAKKSGDVDTISSQISVANQMGATQHAQPPQQLQQPLPVINKTTEREQSVVMLLEKGLNYLPTEDRGDKSKNISVTKIPPHNFDENTPLMQHQLPLHSMAHMQQLNDQIATQMQQIPIQSTVEKKPSPSKKPANTKQSKTGPTGRRVPNTYKNPVTCDICFKTISSKKNLRVHKTVKHFKNGSFSCHICGRNFALNRDLQRHMPLHTNERNYVCQYCGLQCKQPGHLTKHIRTHTEVMNWRCDVCFKNFRVQSDLKAHCFNDHKDITEKNLNCSVCKEKLKLPNSVYLHSLRHSGVREFECPICKATFKLKQHMQVHMKTHEKSTNQETHQCPICMKVFRSKSQCVKHTKKHEEQTPEEFQEKMKEKQSRKSKGKSSRNESSSKKQNSTITSSGSEDANNELQDEDKSTKRKQKLPSKILFENRLSGKKKRVSSSDQFLCDICSDIFETKNALIYHKKIVHGNHDHLLNPDAFRQPFENTSQEQGETIVISPQVETVLPNDDERTDLRLPEFPVSSTSTSLAGATDTSENLPTIDP